jgi:hypothetical protein
MTHIILLAKSWPTRTPQQWTNAVNVEFTSFLALIPIKNVFDTLEYSPPKYLLTMFNALGVTTQSQHLHNAYSTCSIPLNSRRTSSTFYTYLRNKII